MSIASVNPVNNTTVKKFKAATDHEIKAAINCSEAAFSTWKDVPISQRAKLMYAAADIFEKDIDLHAKLMTLEMGKTAKEARSEIEKCAACCRYYAKHAEGFLTDQPLKVDHGTAYIQYSPIGTVLAVMPWNFPYWQVIRFAAPNLMAGNVGILKHASSVPQVALAIAEVFSMAGFPVGVFQTLLISGDATKQILEHPSVKAATLTGSEKAGGIVASIAGKHLKKTVLELGGSDPFIVLADADLDEASTWAVKSRMVNNGQSCIAAKRFIVVAKAYDEFLKLFTAKMEALKIGDPSDSDMDYGPMAQESLAEELLKQVKESVKAGAKVVLGGDRPKRSGAFFNPTILTDIPIGCPAYEEELFGPVASVFKVENEEEALVLANSSRFGLGGSVWTADTKKGITIAEKVESGAVYVNKMMSSDPAVPFGGIKTSGYGRELSKIGLYEFMNQKAIWIAEQA